MTFKEAKERLDAYSFNYHCLGYELTTYQGGKVSVKCKLYTASRGWFEAPTWEGAFEALQNDIDKVYLHAQEPKED